MTTATTIDANGLFQILSKHDRLVEWNQLEATWNDLGRDWNSEGANFRATRDGLSEQIDALSRRIEAYKEWDKPLNQVWSSTVVVSVAALAVNIGYWLVTKKDLFSQLSQRQRVAGGLVVGVGGVGTQLGRIALRFLGRSCRNDRAKEVALWEEFTGKRHPDYSSGLDNLPPLQYLKAHRIGAEQLGKRGQISLAVWVAFEMLKKQADAEPKQAAFNEVLNAEKHFPKQPWTHPVIGGLVQPTPTPGASYYAVD